MAEERIIRKLAVSFLEPPIENEDLMTWVNGTLTLTNFNLWFSRLSRHAKVPINSIISMGRRAPFSQNADMRGQNVDGINYSKDLVVDYSKDGAYMTTAIRAGYDILAYIRGTVYPLALYNVPVKFISPAGVGGVFKREVQWSDGAAALQKQGVALVCGDKTATIPFDAVVAVRKDETGQTATVVIDHQGEDAKPYTSWVSLPGTAGMMLHEYLRLLVEERMPFIGLSGGSSALSGISLDITSNLTEEEISAVSALYSGEMDSATLEKLLEKSVDDTDKLIAQLTKLNLAKVVRVRKDLVLTQKGMNCVILCTQKESDAYLRKYLNAKEADALMIRKEAQAKEDEAEAQIRMMEEHTKMERVASEKAAEEARINEETIERITKMFEESGEAAGADAGHEGTDGAAAVGGDADEDKGSEHLPNDEQDNEGTKAPNSSDEDDEDKEDAC